MERTAEVERLTIHGCSVLCLDCPEGILFGIDYSAWTVGPRFMGVKLVPPGLHYVYCSGSGEDIGVGRTGFFLFMKARDVAVFRWDPASEELVRPENPEEEERYADGVRAFDFDANLGPYPLELATQWAELTRHASAGLVARIEPVGQALRQKRAEYDAVALEQVLRRGAEEVQDGAGREPAAGQAGEEDEPSSDSDADSDGGSVRSRRSDGSSIGGLELLEMGEEEAEEAKQQIQRRRREVAPDVHAASAPSAASDAARPRKKRKTRAASATGGTAKEASAAPAAQLAPGGPAPRPAVRFAEPQLRAEDAMDVQEAAPAAEAAAKPPAGQAEARLESNQGAGTLFFSTVPRARRKVAGATPAETTWRHMDRSAQLEQMLSREYSGNEMNILGELQIAYIAFLLGQNYDGFQQWRELLQLLCSCEATVATRPELYVELCRVFFAHLSQAPADLFGDDLTKDNFLGSCTLSLLELCDAEGAPTKLRRRCGKIRELVQQKFGVSVEDLAVLGEDAPQIVDGHGRDLIDLGNPPYLMVLD